MKKEYKIILVLFILAFIIRLLFVFHTPVKIWDETVYANLGYDLSSNPFHYSLKGASWSDFIPSKENPIYAWPNMGFRAPLLPYTLMIFYSLKVDSLIILFIPLIGALSVVLIYFFGKKLFNEKIGFYSAVFFMLIPLHTLNSGMILTGVYSTFFILLTFISFWKGYEKGNKNYKIFFGIFFALALLVRYTVLWIMPIFLIYFLIRKKSFKFLKDKYLWYSILAFFIVLIPWFIYGQFTYGNPLGAFIHGASAASYWGGIQSALFYFKYWWTMFSIIGFLFILSLGYILYKKDFIKKEIYLLLIWFLFFLVLAMYMPHKEERFILPIVPVICLISGFFIFKIKKYRKLILFSLIIILILSNTWQFYSYYKKSYTGTNQCFLEANDYLKNINQEVLVISDESAVTYYYTKQQIRFYPNPWGLEALRKSIENTYDENRTYIFFTDYDMPLYDEEHIKIKEDLDNNFKKVFECDKDFGLSVIYKYN